MNNLAVAAEIRTLLVALAASETKFDSHTRGLCQSYVALDLIRAVREGDRELFAQRIALLIQSQPERKTT